MANTNLGPFYRLRKHMPRKWKFFFARNLFGLMPTTSRKAGEALMHNRMVLAARYLNGDGIEIGALSGACPMPPGARVKYLDRFDDSGLYTNFPEIAGRKIVRPDIVDNAETMATVTDASQDFLIANHVIEHLPNPLLFMRNAVRVLKGGGILYLAIPNKEQTFDNARPVTTFEHLLEDYKNGPAGSRRQHYEEFVRLADTHNGTQAWKTEEEYKALVQKLMDEDYSIHFHVWDIPAMMEFMLKATQSLSLPLTPEAMVATHNEAVFVLRKKAA